MIVVLVRSLAMVLGGMAVAVAVAEGIRLLFAYRVSAQRRFLWMACQRLATALGGIFIITELSAQAGSTTLTYRTPLAFCIFSLVLIAVVGIARDDTS